MKWPLPQDFNEAVQNPAVSFADPDLASGEVITGPHGLPLPHSGNFADVYQVRGPDGTHWAVKCFTRPVFGLNVRYARLAEELEQASLRFTVGFTFLADGIRVRGDWRPVIKMEWVEGRPLNQVVADNAGNPKVLRALVHRWVKLCGRLRDAGIAHGDIQHGNVLLVPGSRPGHYGLKLVDYDGMFVPSLASTPSGEAGHPNFQHPERVTTRAYSPDLDRFPHLVVVTALTALEHLGPDLWSRYDNGDNLLFIERDFRDPANSAVMRELWQSGHAGVQSLVGRLALSCGRSLSQTPWIDEIAPEGEPLPLNAREDEVVSALLGSAGSFLPVMPVFDPAAEEPPEQPRASPPPADLTLGDLRAPGWEAMKESRAEPEPEYVDYPEPEPEPEPEPQSGYEAEPEYEPEPEYEEEYEEEYDRGPVPRSGRSYRDRDSPRPRSLPRRSRGPNYLPGLIAAAAILVAVLTGITLLVVFSRDDVPREPVVSPGFTQTVPGPVPVPNGQPPVRPNGFVIVPPGTAPVSRPVPPPQPPPTYNALTTDRPDLEMRPRWSARTTGFGEGPFVIDSASETLFYGTAARPSFMAVNLRTGEPRPGFQGMADSPIVGIYPLDGGRVATFARDAQEVLVWTVANGEVSSRIRVPTIPEGFANTKELMVWVSPSAQFLVAARNGGSTGLRSVPFLLADAATGKSILATGWKGGRVFFSADSRRLLVAGHDGKIGWFNLPGGESAGGWDFDGGINKLGGMSSDGRVIAYAGLGRRIPRMPSASLGPRLIDGATGADLRLFERKDYDIFTPPAISGDGRLAVLKRNIGTYGPQFGAVLDIVDAPNTKVLGRVAYQGAGNPPVAMAPDGRTLAVLDYPRHIIHLFDIPGQ